MSLYDYVSRETENESTIFKYAKRKIESAQRDVDFYKGRLEYEQSELECEQIRMGPECDPRWRQSNETYYKKRVMYYQMKLEEAQKKLDSMLITFANEYKKNIGKNLNKKTTETVHSVTDVFNNVETVNTGKQENTNVQDVQIKTSLPVSQLLKDDAENVEMAEETDLKDRQLPYVNPDDFDKMNGYQKRLLAKNLVRKALEGQIIK